MEAGVILERQSTADWGARPGPFEDGIYHAKSSSLPSRPPATVAPGQLAMRGRSVRDPHSNTLLLLKGFILVGQAGSQARSRKGNYSVVEPNRIIPYLEP
ncbi:hypothetical protein I7I51_05994 [Histoplasma capsulatum]|uniref:Uncharacterized protein n=1 Tax=Ajellomyces capsulatus TaxID=5037 RepID=A0A8A1MKP5_AJECA|nr:hypothetical protein I7I51_05994 [Histoplasma capsulatum]